MNIKIKKLGSGAYGTTYLIKNNKKYALKIQHILSKHQKIISI